MLESRIDMEGKTSVSRIVDCISSRTKAFIAEMPKSKRKLIGQFFTSSDTARFMAGMFDFSLLAGRRVSILDPGSGSGILSGALIERIMNETAIKEIHLVCYETDADVIPLLKENLDIISSLLLGRIEFDYQLKNENYITSQGIDFSGGLFSESPSEKFDLIISNPPYLKIPKNDQAALSMPSVVHGAPNLYFLFAAMSLFNLNPLCEMVYIIPRSWTSGAYFEAFRKYILGRGRIIQVHLFVSREKVFSQESVLQETMIVKIKKTEQAPSCIVVSSCETSDDLPNRKNLLVPYNLVVSGKQKFVFLPVDENDLNVISLIHRYSDTLSDLGYKMRTGIVVDFRQRKELRTECGSDTVPLFYCQHIKNGRVNHEPSGKGFDWISDSNKGLIQRNKNYVFCKRFTAKEEPRRLQCGIYLSNDFCGFDYIATQNKINFVERLDKEDIPIEMIYGIFALLNSSLFDSYYRILNGSTQVNSSEVNTIPVPPASIVWEIGLSLENSGRLDTIACDELLEKFAYGKD